ncbi:MAG: DUF6088 family protein [Parvibaculum sp.]|uniref:DUF6088 family protein n=1 Tax=Parvibaculum sp. TaxID=2024848 RepID=UPI00271AC2D2|nr:DUF6088 family protein [Parvibaculum sp.]MDO8837398.1 DUF6088 family protein [Parvibaculum sp.]
MSAIAGKIMKRVRGKGRGWVFTPKDFIDFGTRGSVDMALSRLVRSGTIRRIGRGLYDYPERHATLGALGPNTDRLARAVSRQSGDKLTSSGAVAANRLGFSTQVPARATYATSGPTRVRTVAGRTLTLKHARAPVIDKASDRANSLLQALAHIGKDRIDADTIRRLARRLDDRDMKMLTGARPLMPGWLGDIVLKIEAARHG